MNKCFLLLNPEKKFDANQSCRFRETRKRRTFNSKMTFNAFNTFMTFDMTNDMTNMKKWHLNTFNDIT